MLLTWLLLRFFRSVFHCCNFSLKWRNLEASVFNVALGSPMAIPSSSISCPPCCSRCSKFRLVKFGWFWLWFERSSLFDLERVSPEEKLEHLFLILRHFRAKVPLPLANKGVGAILEYLEKWLQPEKTKQNMIIMDSSIHGGPKWLKFQPKMPRLDTMRYWYLGIYPS